MAGKALVVKVTQSPCSKYNNPYGMLFVLNAEQYRKQL